LLIRAEEVAELATVELDDDAGGLLGALERQDEENVVVGAEAVAEVVAGRGGFAFFCSGTGRMLGVGAIRHDLRFGRHRFCRLLVHEFRARGCRVEGWIAGKVMSGQEIKKFWKL